MIFGIHSLLFRETFVEKDLPLLEHVKRMGFDAVEIIPFDPDHFPAAKVKSVAADLGLVVNTGYGMPEQYNIISPDPAVRSAGVAFSKRLIDLSQEAGHELGVAVVGLEKRPPERHVQGLGIENLCVLGPNSARGGDARLANKRHRGQQCGSQGVAAGHRGP